MNIDNSNYDFCRLVSPVECTSFVNVYWRQPGGNYQTKYPDRDDCFTQGEFLSVTDKKNLPLGKVDCVIFHLMTSSRASFHEGDPAVIEACLTESSIEKLYRILKPGAVVIIKGQIPLEFTIKGVVSFCNTVIRRLRKSTGPMGFNSYVRMLKVQGFRNTRSFNVVSGWDDPHSIVSTDYTASKCFFNNYMESRRMEYTLPRYIFMKLLITLNLIRYMEKNYLVVAQK